MTISETLTATRLASLDLGRYVIVEDSTTVEDAVRKMAAAGESCTCVVREQRLVGIFTQRDVLRVIGRPSKWDRPIADELTHRVWTIGIDQTVADGLAIMTHGGSVVSRCSGTTAGWKETCRSTRSCASSPKP